MPPSSLTAMLATGGLGAGQTQVKQLTAPAKGGDVVTVCMSSAIRNVADERRSSGILVIDVPQELASK